MSVTLLVSAEAAQAGVSATRRVSPRGLVGESAVAVAAGRTAVLMAGYRSGAHRHDFSLYARLGDATSLGRFQRLGANPSSPQIAVGADGTAVAAWASYLRPSRSALRVAVARAGHDFGRVQTLSRARSITLGGVGVSARGRAVVAWRPGTSPTPVQVALAAPGRRFGAPQNAGRQRV